MILVDGMGRSGTSLLGRLLADSLAPAGYVYFYEPFKHPTPAGPFEGWEAMIGRALRPGQSDPPLEAVLDRLRAAAGGAPLLWKEIRLALKQDWLLARLPELRIVHLTRDILGVWSSHRRAAAPDWMANHRRIWRGAAMEWSANPEILRAKGVPGVELLNGIEGRGEAEAMAILWTLNEGFVRTLDSDRLIRVRYEDLCRAPEAELDRIHRFLGISFGGEVRKRAVEHVADTLKEVDPSGRGTGLPPGSMPEIWRERLEPAEIERILAVAGECRRSLGYPEA